MADKIDSMVNLIGIEGNYTDSDITSFKNIINMLIVYVMDDKSAL